MTTTQQPIYCRIFKHLTAIRAAGLLCLCVCLFACTPTPPSFTASDITGSTIATAPWRLQDAQGNTRTLASFKGKVLVVFFGFTHCPEICPTTLMDYANALKALAQQGVDTGKIQVVLATLDPERDVFPALQTFTAGFDPSFIALRGDAAATKAAADSFKVVYEKAPNDIDTTNYSIDHTAASYVFDAQGNVRLFVRSGQPLEALVQDLKTLLAQ